MSTAETVPELLLSLLPSAMAAAPEIGVDVHGLIHAQTVATSVDGEPLQGSARLARVRAIGSVRLGDKLHGQIQGELTGGFTLLDARVDAVVTPWLTMTLGQTIVPYSRSWNTPLPVVALGDRSFANSALSPGRRLGAHAKLHQGPLTAWVGLYDATAPPDLLGDEHAPMGAARLQVATAAARPNSEVPSFQTVETGLVFGAGVSAEPSDTQALVRGTLDAAVHVSGFSAQAEGFLRGVTGSEAAVGGSLQLGQFLVPRRLAVHGRLTALGPGATDEVTRLVPELGVTGYVLDTHALLQVRARLGGPTASPRTGQVMLRGQLAF